MQDNLLTLLKKDFKLMLAGKFFLLAFGSLVLYSCYINFIYVKVDQEIFPVYIYDPGHVQMYLPSSVVQVESRTELQARCEDGYSVGIDLSGGEKEIYMVSCGVDSLDRIRSDYAAAELTPGRDSEARNIGHNDKEMKNRREMTAECLFFEIAAVGFLGLAAMVFKEKQMGVIRIHGILPMRKSLFIVSKTGLILLSDLIFTVLLTLLNLGFHAGGGVLPEVLLNAGIFSLVMALTGFFCAIAVPDFRQFSLLYLVLAIFITTPVFLAGQTGASMGWIKYHPMYYLFIALKKSYFQEKGIGSIYYIICIAVVIMLFLAVKWGLDREMTKEG